MHSDEHTTSSVQLSAGGGRSTGLTVTNGTRSAVQVPTNYERMTIAFKMSAGDECTINVLDVSSAI